MATGGLVKQLSQEATCSVCLDYFQDPVTITECGHNFCRGCLAQCWGESEDEAACPQCRKTAQPRNLLPNRQLANVVEIVKELSRWEEKGPDTKQVEGEGRICEKHQEPFKLFCQQDEILICVVCDRSKGHRSHEVVPLEEASQEYKDKFHASLKTVREERAKLLTHRADITKESRTLLGQTKSETRRTTAELRKLRRFLEIQEKLLLGRMALLEEDIARERDEHLARVSRELSCLESLIRDMEEKQQQPDVELLQDVRSTLKRYEERQKFGDLVAFAPELKQKVCDVHGINDFLEDHMEQFKDSLARRLQLQKGAPGLSVCSATSDQDGYPSESIRRNVTLDPDTAYPRLVLSKNRKSVKWQWESQELPNNPERFDSRPFVMGCEEFTAGQHFWEVIVGSEDGWAVGVARKSTRRKGWIHLCPEEGIWAVSMLHGVYYACNDPHSFPLSLIEEPNRILVSLNYEGCRVTFFNPHTATVLHEFSGASFSGETLQPFFYVEGTPHLRLAP